MAGDGSGRSRFVGVAVGLTVCALSLVWALVGPGTGTAAAAGTSCAQRVLRVWTDNGRVDGMYPSKCYLDAIGSLPEDVRTYSSAVDDISRAMQSSQQTDSTNAAASTTGDLPQARRISSDEARQISAQSPSSVRGLPPALLAVIVIAGAMTISGVTAYFLRRWRDDVP